MVFKGLELPTMDKDLAISVINLSKDILDYAKKLCLKEEFKIAMGNIHFHNGKYCKRKAYKKARFKKMYKRIYEKYYGTGIEVKK